MKTTRFFHISILATLALAAAACSDSSSSPGKTTGSTGSKTTTGGTATATAGSTATTSGTTSGGTTATAGSTATGTTDGTTSSPTTTTGGTGGAGSLMFDATGWVDKTVTGDLGIQGAFYPYADSLGMNGMPPGDCQGDGFTTDQCSTISVTYDAVAGKICATGTAAMVANDMTGMPAYSQIWGAGIGFDLNSTGGDASTKMPYDAAAHHVAGVSFDIDNLPVGAELRVEFPTPAMATTAHYDIVNDNHFEARFDQAALFYTTPADMTPIDTTMINSFQWHVATNTKAAVPFNFCLSNIKVIME